MGTLATAGTGDSGRALRESPACLSPTPTTPPPRPPLCTNTCGEEEGGGLMHTLTHTHGSNFEALEMLPESRGKTRSGESAILAGNMKCRQFRSRIHVANVTNRGG